MKNLSLSILITLIVSQNAFASDATWSKYFEPLVMVSCQEFSRVKSAFPRVSSAFDSAFSDCSSGTTHGTVVGEHMERKFQQLKEAEIRAGGNGVVNELTQIKYIFTKSSENYYQRAMNSPSRVPEDLKFIQESNPRNRSLLFYYILYPVNTSENQEKLLLADYQKNQKKYSTDSTIVFTCLNIIDYLDKKESSIGVALEPIYTACFDKTTSLLIFNKSEFSNLVNALKVETPDGTANLNRQDVINFFTLRSSANIRYLMQMYDKVDSDSAKAIAGATAYQKSIDSQKALAEAKSSADGQTLVIEERARKEAVEREAEKRRQEEATRKRLAEAEIQRRHEEQRRWDELPDAKKKEILDNREAQAIAMKKAHCNSLLFHMDAMMKEDKWLGAEVMSKEYARNRCPEILNKK